VSLKSVNNFVKTNPVSSYVKRKINNPFYENSDTVIIHTAHHKVGTNWIGKVLNLVAKEFGLPIAKNDISKLPCTRPAIFFQNRVYVIPGSMSNYRGSHMIRDPRDIVLSGYHYHLWTAEEWCNKKIKDLPADMEKVWPLLPANEIKDMTYKEYLKSLPQEEGILTEMKRASTTTIKEIVEWNYMDDNIFEFKYEDIMQDEEEYFRRLFRHYGFKENAMDKALKIARSCSFSNVTKRDVGEVDKKSHLRSGKLQQWKVEYTDKHKECFKELHGKDLIKLGYESDLNW
jgi:hypothetical protein